MNGSLKNFFDKNKTKFIILLICAVASLAIRFIRDIKQNSKEIPKGGIIISSIRSDMGQEP